MEIDNAQTILDAGAKNAAHVETIAGIPSIVTPSGAAPLTAILDVADKRADKPRRRTGTAEHQSIRSFVEYVNRFKSDATAIFADESARRFVGVLNYHPAGADSPPAWGDHRAVYPCPASDEWTAWGAGRAVTLGQDDFAEFLDAHDRDLASGVADANGKPYPAPAQLVTLAESLEAYSNKSGKRERKGSSVKLVFTEDSGVKANVEIPTAFAIKIPVFADSEAVAHEVRLRVESNEGAPSFVFQIHDSPKVLRAAFAALVEDVEKSTSAQTFIATPEK